VQNNDGSLSLVELMSNCREELGMSPADFPDSLLVEFFHLVQASLCSRLCLSVTSHRLRVCFSLYLHLVFCMHVCPSVCTLQVQCTRGLARLKTGVYARACGCPIACLFACARMHAGQPVFDIYAPPPAQSHRMRSPAPIRFDRRRTAAAAAAPQ